MRACNIIDTESLKRDDLTRTVKFLLYLAPINEDSLISNHASRVPLYSLVVVFAARGVALKVATSYPYLAQRLETAYVQYKHETTESYGAVRATITRPLNF